LKITLLAIPGKLGQRFIMTTWNTAWIGGTDLLWMEKRAALPGDYIRAGWYANLWKSIGKRLLEPTNHP
jgi:hypothetical protein